MSLLRSVVGLTTALILSTFSAEAREVHIYNWSDYIDEQILKDFEAETGIKVVYDVFDSNEMLETKLLAGASGYDIVVPTASFLARQIKAGIFQKLDESKLSNRRYMWPLISERVATYDPGNAYSITYMWGTTGIGYNADLIKARMKDAPLDSWRLAYDPEVLRRFQDCGVMMLDSSEDLLPSVLNYLGLDPNSKKPEDLEKAGAHLAKLKPYIRKFHSSEYINALANGDICLAVGYSGDILQAKSRAEEAGKTVKVVYTLPKEGAQMWFDQMAIPADAKNVEEAHIFLNYIMKPEVIAKASNAVSYANGNFASKQFVDEKILGDTSIYPDDAVLARLYTVKSIEDPRLQRLLTRIWTKVKSGK